MCSAGARLNSPGPGTCLCQTSTGQRLTAATPGAKGALQAGYVPVKRPVPLRSFRRTYHGELCFRPRCSPDPTVCTGPGPVRLRSLQQLCVPGLIWIRSGGR